MTNGYKPLNYRIVRHVTKTRILTIEDALAWGKVKLDIVQYGRGKGIEEAGVHYLDVQTASLLFWDILDVPPIEHPWWDGWTDYKGSQVDGELQARVFTAEVVEAKNPIKLTIWNGPGEATKTGAVKPINFANGTQVAVLLPWLDARRISLAVLQHIQAWQAATYHARILAGTFQATEDTEAGTVDRRTGEILDEQEATP